MIEGFIDTSVLEPEAPFGESNGYVALEAFNMPMTVTAITHRRKPIFSAIISQVTPSESSVIKKVAYEPLFLAHLRKTMADQGRAARRAARAADQPAPGDFRAIRLRHGEGGGLARDERGVSFMSGVGKVVIAVSDDIDPSSVDAVLWSIAYRCKPGEDVHIVPYRGGGQGSQYGGNRGSIPRC